MGYTYHVENRLIYPKAAIVTPRTQLAPNTPRGLYSGGGKGISQFQEIYFATNALGIYILM